MSSKNETLALPSFSFYPNLDWKPVEVNGENISIPSDWVVHPLSSLADIQSGQSPDGNDVSTGTSDHDGIDFHQGNADFTSKFTSSSGKVVNRDRAPRICKPGSLLLSVRAPVGALNFAKNEICFGRGLCSIFAKATNLQEFIYHLIKANKIHLSKIATGSTFEAIKISDVQSLQAPVPSPDEQASISFILSFQQEQISLLRQLAEHEQQRFEWLSRELLRGRLIFKATHLLAGASNHSSLHPSTDDSTQQNKIYENLSWRLVELNGEKTQVPNHWDICSIGDDISFSIGKTPPKTGDNYAGDLPWATISNLDGAVVKQFTAKIQKNLAKILPAGSLIGSFKMTIGRFSFLEVDAATNEAIIGIPPDGAPKHALEFLRFALPPVFQKSATTNGQGVKLLNTKTIKSLSFVAPPIAEQRLIAKTLSAQEAQVVDILRLADLEQQRLDWLSGELLSGRLRVKKTTDSE